MRQHLGRITGLLGFGVLLACQPACCFGEELRILRFSTYATERPTEELRKMEPFRKAIELGLKDRGINARIEVRIYPTYDDGLNAVVNGDSDVARLGPASYVSAKQRNPLLNLLAVEAHESKKHFLGVIVVTKDSPIRSVADLRGKRLAFGDPISTTGRFLPQAALVRAGLTAKDLSSFSYLGRHDKVIFAVANGGYDAGASNERTFEKYAEERGLRILTAFPSPTQAWVARSGLDAETIKAIRNTLLELRGSALEYIDRNGFLPGNDSDYDELRHSMKIAKDFGG
jgi:phosphonate transport system substrate-binding protein